MTVNDMDQSAERVRLVFELGQDSDGWPPARSERLWAIRVSDDTARLDNIPFFLRGFSLGDVVRFTVDDEDVLLGQEAVEYSDNCTVRVIPAEDGHLAEKRQAVLDEFARLGVDGEGIAQFGLVALNVPASAEIAQVKQLLAHGERVARWHYEEGCVTSAWRAVE
ncbi:DUF4265 domain-containing protein [Streptomyces prunicolor]|uniref:DUF4265 domain-containing protein n=1 Tax=Streptomyces prunicolor TaxID=67348 RepID=UPI00342EE829